MSKQTKAQLQQENLILQQQIIDLQTQLQNRIAVPITPNSTGATLPKANRNTDGVANSDTRVREPMHKPDQPDLDTIAPSYLQLLKISNLLATFNYHPGTGYNASSMQHASDFIKAFNKHINALPNGAKPYRIYTDPDNSEIRLYGDDWKSARNLAAAILLAKSLIKYNVPNPNDMKEEN